MTETQSTTNLNFRRYRVTVPGIRDLDIFQNRVFRQSLDLNKLVPVSENSTSEERYRAWGSSSNTLGGRLSGESVVFGMQDAMSQQVMDAIMALHPDARIELL